MLMCPLIVLDQLGAQFNFIQAIIWWFFFFYIASRPSVPWVHRIIFRHVFQIKHFKFTSTRSDFNDFKSSYHCAIQAPALRTIWILILLFLLDQTIPIKFFWWNSVNISFISYSRPTVQSPCFNNETI